MDGITQAKSQNVICEVEGLFHIMINVKFYNKTMLQQDKICFWTYIDDKVERRQEIKRKWIRE